MLEKIFDPIFAPFRMLRSKVFQVKQLPATLKGDMSRVKAEMNAVKTDANNAKGAVAGAGGMAAGAAKNLPAAKPKGKFMGIFSRSKKCPSCAQKLHNTWTECPYCGWKEGVGATSGPPPAAPHGSSGGAGHGGAGAGSGGGGSGGGGGGSGAPQRTMALDISAVSAGSGIVGWLIPLEGSKAMELFELKGRVSVGTSPDNHVVVPEQSISGHHCEFVGSPTGFKVNDLGSTNGTFVNDKRVTSHDLIDNDNVKLGRIRFKFKSLV